MAIGNSELREAWVEKLNTAGYKVVSLISSKALVSKSSVVEEGCVIMPGAIIQGNAIIGKGVIISSAAVVDHDSTIGAFSHINCGGIVPSLSEVEKGTKVDYGEVWKCTRAV